MDRDLKRRIFRDFVSVTNRTRPNEPITAYRGPVIDCESFDRSSVHSFLDSFVRSFVCSLERSRCDDSRELNYPLNFNFDWNPLDQNRERWIDRERDTRTIHGENDIIRRLIRSSKRKKEKKEKGGKKGKKETSDTESRETVNRRKRSTIYFLLVRIARVCIRNLITSNRHSLCYKTNTTVRVRFSRIASRLDKWNRR